MHENFVLMMLVLAPLHWVLPPTQKHPNPQGAPVYQNYAHAAPLLCCLLAIVACMCSAETMRLDVHATAAAQPGEALAVHVRPVMRQQTAAMDLAAFTIPSSLQARGGKKSTGSPLHTKALVRLPVVKRPLLPHNAARKLRLSFAPLLRMPHPHPRILGALKSRWPYSHALQRPHIYPSDLSYGIDDDDINDLFSFTCDTESCFSSDVFLPVGAQPLLGSLSAPACLPPRDCAAVQSFLDNWHCLGFEKDFDWDSVNAVKVGDIDLVVWRNKGRVCVRPNVCKHLGSGLTDASVSIDGCVVCPYHGVRHGAADALGVAKCFQGKVYWTPNTMINSMPPCMPDYNTSGFAHQQITIDMHAPMMDCAMNLMDIQHPAHLHQGLMGFGTDENPSNVGVFTFDSAVALQFKYKSRPRLREFADKDMYTNNIHMFFYPGFGWSSVSFAKTRCMHVSVDMLPISPHKTRWFVTISHNYLTNSVEQKGVEMAARVILAQDQQQFARQSKSEVMRALFSYQSTLEHEVAPLCPIRLQQR